MKWLSSFVQSSQDYASWLWDQISFESGTLFGNYFWFLGLISLFFFLFELLVPWRKTEGFFRKGFWLDAFYMYFNFFLLYLVLLAGLEETTKQSVKTIFSFLGVENQLATEIQKLNLFWKSIIALLIQDFTHWNIHRLMHRVPILWRFHKVHHSVKEMGFAAHLRFHWIEAIVYKAITFLPLYLFFGFDMADFFYLHLFTTAWGHFNHSNINIPLGPLKYIFNSPQMHIWHHAKTLSKKHQFGVNFGLTLSIWDYIFKTNYIPSNGKTVEIGFESDEHYPQTFFKQMTQGFQSKNKNGNSTSNH